MKAQAFSWLLLFPASQIDAPELPDDRLILQVIEQEAAIIADWGDWRSGRAPCLKPEITESAFDQERDFQRQRSVEVAEPPIVAPTPPQQERPHRIRRPRLTAFTIANWIWARPQPDAAGYLVYLPKDELAEIIRVGSDLIAEKSSTPVVDLVRPEWVRPPYQLCAGGENVPTLTLTSPEIRGDLAFVRAEFQCVLCSHEIVYALRRTGSQWRIIAEALLGQS